MNNVVTIIIFFLLGAMPAWAVDVGDITSFIYSNSTILSKEIKNPTSSGRLINIYIERISDPLESGQKIPMQSDDELLLSPASLLLPAQSNETVRFYYNGPADNTERYYRIIWFDQALSETSKNNNVRHAIATASARISTILVVSPRKIQYDYKYANGTIENKGNATLRVIAYGPCLEDKGENSCKESYYLLPGRARKFIRVNVADPSGRVALWQADQFVSVK